MTQSEKSDQVVTVEESKGDGFSERVEMLISKYGSASNLARLADLSESVVRKWRSGQSDPSRTHLIALAKAANVSIDWLATGEGPMPVSDARNNRLNSDFDLVSLYDVQVSAGHGAHIDDENVIAQIAFRHDWLKQNGFNIKNLVSVNARGDSMSPTVNDGDMLLIDTSQKDVAEDGIYVLRVDSHLLAKRLQRLLDGTIYIKSDNPAYERQEVSKDDTQQLRVIGRVVWSGRRM